MPAKKTTARKATPKKRLAEYTAKRDFDKTPEPAGGHAPEASGDRPRFVVQRHRARALHYDFRLEMDGVLVSWAIPKGPSLDPKVKRLGVHVEDHPVEYFDFEGVDPARRVRRRRRHRLGLGHLRAVHTDDPVQAVADGELHVDLLRREAARPLRADPARARTAAARSSGSSSTRSDEFAVDGLGRRGASRSRCAAAAPTTRSQAEPDAVWRSDAPAALASIDFSSTRADIAALDALGKKGDWEFDGVSCTLTNLDKVLFPPRTKGEKPLTKRDLIRYYAMVAPVMLPYLERRPLNMHRFPNGVDKPGFWQKQVPSHAPDWITRWRNDDAGEGETEWYLVADRPADARVARELRRGRAAPVDVADPEGAATDVRADRHRPGREDDVGRRAHARRSSTGPRSTTCSVRGFPKVTGQRGIQIWVPIEPGPTFDDTRAWVEALSRLVGDTVPDLVSWKWEKRARGGLGAPRLHAERDQQDARRAVLGASRTRRAGVDADHVGRARRSRPAQRPLDDPRRRRARCSRSATCSRAS